MDRIKTADEALRASAQTHHDRSKVYGDTYIRHGEVMAAIFPKGLFLDSDVDFGRFALLDMIVGKLCRYANDFQHPHEDSLHDLTTYAAMLQEVDQVHRDPALTLDDLRRRKGL